MFSGFLPGHGVTRHLGLGCVPFLARAGGGGVAHSLGVPQPAGPEFVAFVSPDEEEQTHRHQQGYDRVEGPVVGSLAAAAWRGLDFRGVVILV